MAIKVRFDKDGWYHPAFGRLGRGDKNAGTIYTLPDQFGETETVEVPVRDPATKRLTGETKQVERFKFLPRTAEIIDGLRLEEITQEAEEAGVEPPAVVRPKADVDELKRATATAGAGARNAPQSAGERTTGRKPLSGRRRATSPADEG